MLTIRKLVAVSGLLSLSCGMMGTASAQGGSGQCRGGGMPSVSSATLSSSLNYPSSPLTQNGYSSTNLLANSYQQQVLATQHQVASLMYQNAERQRLAALERERVAMPYRLARAEAKRESRELRIAAQIARRQQEQQSASSYSFTSINVE